MVGKMSASAYRIDAVDRRILRELADDARQSATEIARVVNLSPSAIRRRIARLEAAGVIARYTIVMDYGEPGPSVEAYIELNFGSSTDIIALLNELLLLPEVRETAMLAGAPDGLVRLRVRDLEQLREVVVGIRKRVEVTGSKTLVALSRARYTSRQYPAERSLG
jgi:Lrp/AsnC family transcriptional regulator, leucine-responsive regulatory protein